MKRPNTDGSKIANALEDTIESYLNDFNAYIDFLENEIQESEKEIDKLRDEINELETKLENHEPRFPREV